MFACFRFVMARKAWGGGLWPGYFNGDGESLLEYNQKHRLARVAPSLVR
jgi:hypothetical protein